MCVSYKVALTRAHGVTFFLSPEVIMVSRTAVVTESLAAVALVIEVPTCRVQSFTVRTYAFVFAFETDGACVTNLSDCRKGRCLHD